MSLISFLRDVKICIDQFKFYVLNGQNLYASQGIIQAFCFITENNNITSSKCFMARYIKSSGFLSASKSPGMIFQRII